MMMSPALPRPLTRILVLLLMVLFLPGRTGHAAGTTIYVDDDAPGPVHDGTSWITAFTDLQQALVPAASGDQIWVAEGTYTPTSGTDRGAVFTLQEGVAIYGGFVAGGDMSTRDWEAHPTTLSGEIGDQETMDDNSYNVLAGNGLGATTLLDGFIVWHGYADGTQGCPGTACGGGLRLEDASPTLSHLRIEANYGSMDGGGVIVQSGNPAFSDVTFDENTSALTGGGLAVHSATVSLEEVVFVSNMAAHGGGMVCGNCTATLDGASFSANVVTYNGAGLLQDGGSVTIEDSDFSGNTAGQDGGGLDLMVGTTELTQVDLTGNSATDHGGGLFNSAASVTVIDSTFTGNTALYGGAISSDGTTTIRDCTFEENSASQAGGAILNQGTLNLAGSLLRANTAANGAGLHHYHAGPATIVSTRFLGNIASSSGGGLYAMSNSTLTLANLVFDGNQAVGLSGGGAFFSSGTTTAVLRDLTFTQNTAHLASAVYASYYRIHIANTLFWSNPGGGWAGSLYSTGPFYEPATLSYSLLEGGCPFSGVACDHLLTTNPYFLDADGADNLPGTLDDNLRLGYASPAIDAGSNALVPADTLDLDDDGNSSEPLPFDLGGGPRFIDHPRADMGAGTPPIVDIGAYEAPPFAWFLPLVLRNAP
jgi:predicted outer membrane repeat protein